jgi:hypothetical protein
MGLLGKNGQFAEFALMVEEILAGARGIGERRTGRFCRAERDKAQLESAPLNLNLNLSLNL